jgi:hypothetical protein
LFEPPCEKLSGAGETAVPTANWIGIARPDDIETKRREEGGVWTTSTRR